MTGSEYYPLDMSCVHCGEKLSARRIFDSSISIKGLHKLAYVHTNSGESACWVQYSARPHDGWRATEAYDRAREAALAEQEDKP
jgi:hypothetical protein